MKNNYEIVSLRTPNQLVEAIAHNIEQEINSYYLILNDWDKPCRHFKSILNGDDYSDTVLYTIDIFDIPNCLEIMRYCIKDHKETVSTMNLSNYDQLPLLVIMHKAFPRIISYNGSIGAELGLL